MILHFAKPSAPKPLHLDADGKEKMDLLDIIGVILSLAALGKVLLG